jgi:PAS domain S-box-containing protein
LRNLPPTHHWRNRAAGKAAWIVFAFIVVGTAALLAAERYHEYTRIERAESARLQGQARTVAENLRQQLLAVTNALAAARGARGERGTPGGQGQLMSGRLHALSGMLPGVKALMALDATGRVWASNDSSMLGQDFSGRDVFTAARDQRNAATLYVSAPRETAPAGYSIHVSRAVIDSDGSFAGTVTALLEPHYFDVVIRSVLYADDMNSSLVHGDGVIFLVQPSIPGILGRNLNHPDAMFTRHMRSGEAATVVNGIARVLGEHGIVAFETLQPKMLNMDKPLVIVQSRRIDPIFADWRRQTAMYAVLALTLAGVAAVALKSAQREKARAREGLLAAAVDLHKQEQWLALTADAAHFGVWIYDLTHDQILASPQWVALYAFAPTEALDFTGLLRRVHADDRDMVAGTFDRMRKGQDGYQMEFRIVRPDGSTRWIDSRGRAGIGSDGRTALIHAVSIDVTERKEAEAQAKERQLQLAHLSRVAMLGGLSGAMAHELNQPLTAILSNAQAAERFLMHDPVDIEELRDILADIVTEDRRAGEVIRGLRQLLSPRDVQREHIDLNALVAEIARLLRGELVNRGVVLHVALAAALPLVDADRVQLQQVLINLILNACDAMRDIPPEGRVLLVECQATGADVHLTVVDRGCGIAAGSLEKVFDSFVTTKPGGMGLGLSVSRSIIQAHNGRIWAENNALAGATFHILLPAIRPGEALES